MSTALSVLGYANNKQIVSLEVFMRNYIVFGDFIICNTSITAFVQRLNKTKRLLYNCGCVDWCSSLDMSDCLGN